MVSGKSMDLSPQDRKVCKAATDQLLEEALHQCHEMGLESMGDVNGAHLDKKRWKKIQSHEHVTMYVDRNTKSAWVPDWENPIAVTTIGRMPCSLDDVLLALICPDTATYRVRNLLMGLRGDNCQHASIITPTQQDPFHFLTVMRLVFLPHWPFTMFSSPREMVLAVATGFSTTKNGKRCAYEVAQSVDLSCLKSTKSIPRVHARQSQIFWEQRDGSIAVYSKVTTDAKNHFPDSFNQLLLCRTSREFWKFVPRSFETKKLWWCVKNKTHLMEKLGTSSQSRTAASCALTDQSKQSERAVCEFCNLRLCGVSKCQIFCQLEMILSCETGFLQQRLNLCLRCATFVRNQSSTDIARAQLDDLEQTS
ncbi:hypothetical protein PsorP6_016880 [Peronosclerospora sorghi]|uniref:Uncharacterized protein n=1 Tax=Peronosclerospora sorghi TaxID=230839 RepID=A0ACC0WD07_9STRA|nr:hypothetical protein PsorP6_016880 [Peronosclerospora sorghi]